MISAFWTGASGMRAYQNALNTTAHNIANVNTFGYKSERPVFEDLLRSRINTNVEGNHFYGHGVKQEDRDILMRQGSFNQTGYPLDFAIAGDGFFGIQINGQMTYTRNGAFDLSIEGNTATLVNNEGGFVVDANGAHITLPVDAGGNVDMSSIPDRLGIFSFQNPFGLEPRNNARFAQTEQSGPATQVGQNEYNGKKNTLLQYTVEMSGVDLAKEMVEVINSQRAFQLNSRVIQTADQMDELLNNLR